MPRTFSNPPVGGCFIGAVSGDDSMVGVTLVFCLWHFCLVHAGFYKVSFRSSFIAAGSDQQRRRPVPAACAAGRECQAVLIGRSSVRSPGTLAGRPHHLWPTQVVIPMTLAPETVEVSWERHGSSAGSFLTEVHSHSSKSQGLASGWRAVGFETAEHHQPSSDAPAPKTDRLDTVS
jgi:hypothetical protein